MTAKTIISELKALARPAKALHAQRFFRTGKGEYGEGDIFIGNTVPQVRSVVRKYPELSLIEVEKLLASPLHEARLCAVLILSHQFKKAGEAGKKKLVAFYLRNKKGVNNWDIVDSSAADILGVWSLLTDSTSEMKKLMSSKRLWDKRIAMIATYAFIKKGRPEVAFQFAEKLVKEEEDLLQKAGGWMLREAGKKDEKALKAFIKKHGKNMGRTMLRYAIEKFPASVRKEILLRTKTTYSA